MDFIERVFGISPDGGDGSTELMVFAVLVTICLLLSWPLVKRRWGVRSPRQ
jgi:hypothetical protein